MDEETATSSEAQSPVAKKRRVAAKPREKALKSTTINVDDEKVDPAAVAADADFKDTTATTSKTSAIGKQQPASRKRRTNNPLKSLKELYAKAAKRNTNAGSRRGGKSK